MVSESPQALNSNSNSTGSSATNRRFFPDIGAKQWSNANADYLVGQLALMIKFKILLLENQAVTNRPVFAASCPGTLNLR